MSAVNDMLVSLGINSVTSVILVWVYAVLKNQPASVRVYYAKWVGMGQAMGPQPSDSDGPSIGRYINLDLRTYAHIMDWIRETLKMQEPEFIKHAGLDSAVYLRMIVLGIKIFLPMMVYSFAVLVPLNVTDDELSMHESITYSSLDTITIQNIRNESSRLWAHLIAAYMYTGWTCFLLLRQYGSIVDLRFQFLASQHGRPDQFTILCRCIPHDPNKPVKEQVEHFFRVNHPDHYLLSQVVYNANTLEKLVKKRAELQNKVTHMKGVIAKKPLQSRPTIRKGFLGVRGERVDRLRFYRQAIDRLTSKIYSERMKVLQEESSVMPAAFVSFETRWAAAVCAQTKQSKDSTKWVTEWAPEPRDVYWANLPIPYLQLNSRRLISQMLLFLIIVFYLIPVSFVQSLANLDNIEKKVSFLKPLIDVGIVRSVLQGYLPAFSLKIFLLSLPFLLRYLSSVEGHVSISKIEKHAAINYLAFMLVNVFLGNVVTGTAFEQLKLFLETPTKIPSVLGNSIPQRAAFFINYIMVDGWSTCASDLVRLWPSLGYHAQNITLVRTEKDRNEATPVGFIKYTTALPRLGLYFLLGFVYSIISPLILPFIIIFLGAAYVVYRNHMIHAYEQRFESAGEFWPVMFSYVLIGLLTMHATLIGLMALKHAASSTPFLLPLPICTILFWYYCNRRFEEGFRNYPLEEAKMKDTLERAQEPNLDPREFLEGAYLHPALRDSITGDGDMVANDSEAALNESSHDHTMHSHSKDGRSKSSSTTKNVPASHDHTMHSHSKDGRSRSSSTRKKVLPEIENEHDNAEDGNAQEHQEPDRDLDIENKLLGHQEP